MKTSKHRIMKNLTIICIALFFTTACSLTEYDNYDSPDSILEGNIIYQGEPIPVGYDNVTFQLWQSGFGKETPINVTVAQDGSFSAELFDGDYRLILADDQGPYLTPTNPETNSDTLLVQVRGNTTLDIEVMPYVMIRNAKFTIADSTVTANFGVEKILSDANGGKNVQSVSLYISKTQFVDERTSISSQTVAAADLSDRSNISLSAKVPPLTPDQGYVFARIGVKIMDVEDLLFSNVTKMQLN